MTDGRQLPIDQLVFVGFNGYVVALDRDNGDIVWSQNNLHGGYVALLLDGDQLIASSNGYMYCLNALTGDIIWHNPLSGYGVGPPSLCSVRGQTNGYEVLRHAEHAHQSQQTSSTTT